MREVVIITWSYYYSFIDGDKNLRRRGLPKNIAVSGVVLTRIFRMFCLCDMKIFSNKCSAGMPRRVFSQPL